MTGAKEDFLEMRRLEAQDPDPRPYYLIEFLNLTNNTQSNDNNAKQ